ncbi:MAG TPA: T9SS type A sorting domain-containing protein [Bacteroidia bacterium]|jgi:hypothetical protein|nr:T9SS type A sorting domain-containing protein [Bacteroidia bacterium]
MKKITFLLLAMSFIVLTNGQNRGNLLGYKNGKPSGTSQYIKCSSFHITKPLRELADANMKTSLYKEDIDDRKGTHKPSGFKPKYSYPADPLIQHRAGSVGLDTPIVNFEGGNWNYRPDANGAAGPNNYVQGVNLCNYNIYDKLGHLILSTDMTTLGGDCSDDPIVVYDKFADRWIVSDVTYGYMNLSIAISVTGDPTGAYYVYTYPFGVMPDFPKYSIWSDGYYANYRDINNDTVGVAVLERNRMLKGDPSAGLILSKFPNTQIVNAESQLPGSPRILFCDGALPVFGTPEYLMYYTNVNMGEATNSIMIYQLKTDTTNKTCVMTFVDSLATAPFNGYFAGYVFGGNIVEPGGQSVWSLEGPFGYHAPYIKFTGYGSVVLCNTVNLGDSVAGVRWYELRQNDTTKKWSIHQQGTYGPNDGISRWNSSICENTNGDISIAYNVTNSTNLYPGIRYTGRLAGDPLGQMTFSEQTARVGTYSFNTQWGDISESWLDPDGLTFWHTNQYIVDSTGNTANVRIFSYRLNSPTGIAPITSNTADLKVYQSGSNLNVMVSGLANDDKVVVNLFDINGKQLSSEWVAPKGNIFQTKINVASLAKGVYLLRIGNIKFQKVSKVVIE